MEASGDVRSNKYCQGLYNHPASGNKIQSQVLSIITRKKPFKLKERNSKEYPIKLRETPLLIPFRDHSVSGKGQGLGRGPTEEGIRMNATKTIYGKEEQKGIAEIIRDSRKTKDFERLKRGLGEET